MARHNVDPMNEHRHLWPITLVLGLLVGIVAVLAIWLIPATSDLRLSPTPTRSATLAEDDPGWDCATMGNRVCGRSATPSPVSSQGLSAALFVDSLQDIRDPFQRCRIALDAAEVDVRLCNPLQPSPKPSASRTLTRPTYHGF